MAEHASVTFLGARGTVPMEGPAVSRHGGATACVLVRMGGTVFVLDGGTGVMELSCVLQPEERSFHLLLSHPHFDHMAGLPACPLLYDPAFEVFFHAAPREGLSPRQQVALLMGPPLWPVGPDAFTARISYHEIKGSFPVGPVLVRVLEGLHPGGCTAFRLEADGISVVYATDYELDERSAAPLEDFARGCTLLLCDGQYSEAEYPVHRGYGHSTWSAAARLARACGARSLRILHHAPWRTDAALDAATPGLRAIFANSAFARCGEEIVL